MQTIISFFELLIGGVKAVFQFVLTIPSFLETMFLSFPPVLVPVFWVIFGIIVAIRVLELLP